MDTKDQLTEKVLEEGISDIIVEMKENMEGITFNRERCIDFIVKHIDVKLEFLNLEKIIPLVRRGFGIMQGNFEHKDDDFLFVCKWIIIIFRKGLYSDRLYQEERAMLVEMLTNLFEEIGVTKTFCLRNLAVFLEIFIDI